jgi:hypothetical protein
MYITIDPGAFPACDGRKVELAAMSFPKVLASPRSSMHHPERDSLPGTSFGSILAVSLDDGDYLFEPRSTTLSGRAVGHP